MKSSKAIYPGTFDPITSGHVDIIRRALALFDEVIVLVAHSRKKKTLFSEEERKSFIEDCFKEEKRLRVEIDQGLLVNFAKKNGIRTIIRGLRAVSDFEYEFQIATMNRRMYPELETLFLMASERFFYVNSTLIKEVIAHGGSIQDLVPEHVEKRLREALA